MNLKQRRRQTLAHFPTAELYRQRNSAGRLLAGWRGSNTGKRFLHGRIAALSSELRRRKKLSGKQMRLLDDLRRQSRAARAAGLNPLAAAATPGQWTGDKATGAANGPVRAFNGAVAGPVYDNAAGAGPMGLTGPNVR